MSDAKHISRQIVDVIGALFFGTFFGLLGSVPLTVLDLLKDIILGNETSFENSMHYGFGGGFIITCYVVLKWLENGITPSRPKGLNQ